MNDLRFSTENGEIRLDGKVIAPLSLSDVKTLASDERLRFNEFQPNGEWTTIGIDVNIQGQQCGMNISYRGNTLQVCWFDWGGGMSFLKGYESSESELIADKNSLTKMIGAMLGKAPDKNDYTSDMFIFEWGYISTSASIQSVIVSVGVVWTALPQ